MYIVVVERRGRRKKFIQYKSKLNVCVCASMRFLFSSSSIPFVLSRWSYFSLTKRDGKKEGAHEKAVGPGEKEEFVFLLVLLLS